MYWFIVVVGAEIIKVFVCTTWMVDANMCQFHYGGKGRKKGRAWSFGLPIVCVEVSKNGGPFRVEVIDN